MDNDTFTLLVDKQLNHCAQTLVKKGEEYASDVDRLHNFKVAARINGTTPEKALWGMYTKHLVSVMDLVEYPGHATEKLMFEKIGDSINYMVLLKALLVERMREECPAPDPGCVNRLEHVM